MDWTHFSFIDRVLTVCEAAPVLGRPRYLARFVEQGLCRVRWLAAAVIPFWIATIFLHLWFAQEAPDVVAGMGGGALGPRLAVILPLVLAVAGALLVLVVPRRAAPISTVRLVVALCALAALGGEGLQLGLSHGAAYHMPSYVLANLVVLTIFPLSSGQLAALAAYSLLVPLVAGATTGMESQALLQFSATLTLPAAAAVFGVVLNLWYLRNYRQRSMAELRLRRRTVELELQRAETERERAEAVRQHAEAERQLQLAEGQREEAELQRQRAMQLLSSALTGPVAERYARQGFVEPSTRHVVLLFCDAVGFSQSCEKMLPERIVAAMREFWLRFDDACLSVGVEPLHAEGDARIAIAGLGMEGGPVHMHRAAIGALLAMLRFRRSLPPLGEAEGVLRKVRDGGYVMWPARIGVTIGPVAAGVIDTSHVLPDASGRTRAGRLWFDVWGDTLNVAARLAQSARPNQIITRERVLWEAGGLFEHGPLHGRRVKKSVLPDCTEVFGIRPEYRDAEGEPNEAFWEVYNSESYRPARPDPRGTGTENGNGDILGFR